MRIWTLHPHYLDTQGLLALWRETLLAKKVLEGNTRGYTRHPQLIRFRAHAAPLDAISFYLHHIHAEATTRNYRFDDTKIPPFPKSTPLITATTGQLAYEMQHLANKLAHRSPTHHTLLQPPAHITPHPLFAIVPGPLAPWEII